MNSSPCDIWGDLLRGAKVRLRGVDGHELPGLYICILAYGTRHNITGPQVALPQARMRVAARRCLCNAWLNDQPLECEVGLACSQRLRQYLRQSGQHACVCSYCSSPASCGLMLHADSEIQACMRHTLAAHDKDCIAFCVNLHGYTRDAFLAQSGPLELTQCAA